MKERNKEPVMVKLIQGINTTRKKAIGTSQKAACSAVHCAVIFTKYLSCTYLYFTALNFTALN